MRSQTSAGVDRRARAFVAAAAAIACVAAVATASASASVNPAYDAHQGTLPRLKGFVGPGFEISINRDSVSAGRYRMIVRDRGTIHNFHFFGSGVDRKTSIPGTGRTVWRLTLDAGTYTAACVPHGSMSTNLTVT